MAMQGKGRILGALVLGACLGSGAGVALAQGMGHGMGPGGGMPTGMMGMDDMGGFGHGRMLERLDGDGDGSVSRDEMQAHRAGRFAGFDGDGDGRVTRDEIAAAMQARMAERFGRMADRMVALQDADGDGAISAQEFGRADRMEMMFLRLDQDGDGTISAKEAEKVRGRGMDDDDRGRGYHHGYHARHGGYGHGTWDDDGRDAD